MEKFLTEFKVVANRRLNREYVVIELKHPSELPEMHPGQFVQIKVENTPSTYLRRPISIHDVDKKNNSLRLLVQEVGDGTRWMGTLIPGQSLNLIYPLGNWFDVSASDKPLLVGGGCGIAPLLFLGKQMKEIGISPSFLIGAKSASALIELKEYEDIGDVYITTEDGSIGTKGYVIHHSIMRTDKPNFKAIYTCGPEPMMKVLAKYAGSRNMDCFVSLENQMACGFGACLCCVTETIHGNKCTCIDGPVFNSKELKW